MSSLTLGLLLALISTISTAFAHAYLKASNNKLAVQAWVRLTGFAVALPFAFWVGLPPASLVPWIVGAASIHAVYQLTLTWSYTVSDFSVAYPLARGATPVFTSMLGVSLLGDRLGLFMVVGIVIITLGILLLSRKGGLTKWGLVAAMLSALLTTAYTIVDAHGVRLAPEPLLFIVWYYMADGISMPAALIVKEGKGVFAALASEVSIGAPAGILALLAFVPALFAFDLAPVGAVSALRECSVLIGLALGGAMLKERLDRNRIFGAMLIMIGGFAIIAQSF